MKKSQHKTARLGAFGAAALALLAFAGTALAAAPVNSAAPTITGTARVGETLTVQNGTWTNNPTAFQYQWQRCSAAGASCVDNRDGDPEDLYGRDSRLRAHTPRPCHRGQRRRRDQRPVGCDRRRTAEHRAAEPAAALDRGRG